jgi:hypothetical protein
MRRRTRHNDRYYSNLRAIRRQSFGAAGHIRARPGSYGANGTPSVHPRAVLLVGIHGRSGSDWPRPDNIAAVHSRTDDSSRCSQARRYGPGGWNGLTRPQYWRVSCEKSARTRLTRLPQCQCQETTTIRPSEITVAEPRTRFLSNTRRNESRS